MNLLVVSNLAGFDHQDGTHHLREVIDRIGPFAFGPTCGCGADKRTEVAAFCDECKRILIDNGLGWELRFLTESLGELRSHYKAGGSNLHGVLKHFDRLVDYLRAIRRGYYVPTGKRKTSLESEDAWT